MDTSYEESSIFSQLEGCDTSPMDNESQLNLALSPPKDQVTVTNSNALSPFSSLTSRITAPKPSSSIKSEQQEADQDLSAALPTKPNLPFNRAISANSNTNNLLSSSVCIVCVVSNYPLINE